MIAHLASAIIGALLGVGLAAAVDSYLPKFVSLACVEQFSGRAFHTDNTVRQVEVGSTAYIVTRFDGVVTLVPRTDTLVCSLSREYLPNATTN